MRFRCLHKTGGCINLAPDRCCKVILACFMLHNICVRNKIPIEDNRNEEDEGQVDEDNIYQGAQNDGHDVRSNLIRNRFA